ncbi:Aryl-alcohol dehydrogenase (NADP(+)) [Bacillus subtilis subsp. subtilis]|nr:Aryl-alcohol dehydrogenase (NADP(+)) [Bacillus subtilis subsp. subtilis]
MAASIFIDTAFIYGLGRSEELIGEVVQERGVRNELIIATKGAHKEVNGSIELDNSREFLRSEVEKSLKRLKTDYIDLYYVHFPDGKTPLAEVAGTLKELKDEGKIKAIGASNLDYSYSVMPRKSFFHTVKNKASPLFLTFRLRPDC